VRAARGFGRGGEVGAARMPPCMGGAPWNADAWGVSWCGGSSACAAGRLHGAAAVSMLRRQPPPRSGSVRWAGLGCWAMEIFVSKIQDRSWAGPQDICLPRPLAHLVGPST